jgi:hypothetical protein
MPRHFNPKVTQYKQPDHVGRQGPGGRHGSGRRSRPFARLRSTGTAPSLWQKVLAALLPWRK